MLRHALLPLTLLSLASTPGVAAAQEASSTDSIEDAELRKKGRRMDFEFGFRVRRMTVPRGLLDIWYHDADDPRWPIPGEDRPFINGWSYGVEFIAKDDRANAIVWIDWIDSNMPTGYWDDVEDPPNFQDGDYLRPSSNLGLFTFGADYMYDIPMVRHSQTKGVFGMSFNVGAGLGVAFLMGRLERWVPDDALDRPAYVLFQSGEPANADDKDIPRIYPMVDFNMGLRFNFANRFVLRLEGGLHTMLYYGASAGFQF
jgi:hypothetical protein